jgi:hypothetical protein
MVLFTDSLPSGLTLVFFQNNETEEKIKCAIRSLRSWEKENTAKTKNYHFQKIQIQKRGDKK